MAGYILDVLKTRVQLDNDAARARMASYRQCMTESRRYDKLSYRLLDRLDRYRYLKSFDYAAWQVIAQRLNALRDEAIARSERLADVALEYIG